jgi:hypothetical protein
MWRSRVVVAGVATALAASACGAQPTPISPGCTGERGPVMKALERAPSAVRLVDGTRLSRCISDGTDDAELQDVGITFHGVAEDLRVRAREHTDESAAVQLGYLVGATRLGARHTNGVMAELQRRIELVGGRLQDESPTLAAAVQRGVAAGEATG